MGATALTRRRRCSIGHLRRRRGLGRAGRRRRTGARCRWRAVRRPALCRCRGACHANQGAAREVENLNTIRTDDFEPHYLNPLGRQRKQPLAVGAIGDRAERVIAVPIDAGPGLRLEFGDAIPERKLAGGTTGVGQHGHRLSQFVLPLGLAVTFDAPAPEKHIALVRQWRHAEKLRAQGLQLGSAAGIVRGRGRTSIGRAPFVVELLLRFLPRVFC